VNRCPYCELEDDVDYIAEGHAPFDESDVLICDGCGGVEIATGVLWETRPATGREPSLALLRRTYLLTQRPAIIDRFAQRLGPARDHQQIGRHIP
jgi:hypothetical protein